MKKTGTIICFFTCPDKGMPMEKKTEALFIAGVGIEDDRYATGKGAYSKGKREVIRHVSLFSMEALEEANRSVSVPFLPEETRRNVFVSCNDLNSLVEKEFFFGGVKLRGVELCDPCGRPSVLVQKKGFLEAFALRGGLRAEVLVSGEARAGDEIFVVE